MRTSSFSGRCTVLVATIMLVSVGLTACAITLEPPTIRPRGFLEANDYAQLQSEADQRPFRKGGDPKVKVTPVWAYHRTRDVDLRGLTSISIPAFKPLDPSTEEAVVRATVDQLAKLLLEKNLFTIVDTTGQTQADLTLLGAVMKYKQISGGERAATFLPLGGWIDARAHLVLELRLIETKTKDTVAIIQVNVAKAISSLGFKNLSSARPEAEVPGYLATILGEIKLAKPGGEARGNVSREAEYLFMFDK